MRATGRLDGNHGNAERTFLFSRFRRRSGHGRFFEPIDLLDQYENSESHDGEINNGIYEYAVVDGGDPGCPGSVQRRVLFNGQANEKIAEVNIAHKLSEGRRQDVRYKRGNDFSEGRANDDAYGHVYDISLHREFFKFFKHLFLQ